jgi:serine/threonine-protein kinase RIO1
MVKFYGVKRFEVFSDVDPKWLNPKETMIEFYYDTSKKVNHKRLQRILERDIKNVNSFFVVVEDDKIIIHIDYYKKVGLMDYDFEFCEN